MKTETLKKFAGELARMLRGSRDSQPDHPPSAAFGPNRTNTLPYRRFVLAGVPGSSKPAQVQLNSGTASAGVARPAHEPGALPAQNPEPRPTDRNLIVSLAVATKIWSVQRPKALLGFAGERAHSRLLEKKFQRPRKTSQAQLVAEPRGPRFWHLGSAFLKCAVVAAVLLALSPRPALAQNSELEQLKAALQQMQKTINEQNAKIAEMEKRQTNAPPRVEQMYFKPESGTNIIAGTAVIGHASPITARHALNDQQEAAARPKDYTLDPDYRGYFPIPNTPFLMMFNPKPHLDLTIDNRNSGDKYRFVTARIPVEGQPNEGGGEQLNINANASQLRIDVRAPSVAGDFRFYYQNDFFGQQNADMRYRLQHLYGQYYNVIAGFTYGVFEDPDGWPDTVDYEGPNSVIFARRALVQYKLSISDNWIATFGVEKPDIFLDTTSQANAFLRTPIPDLGFNVRWEAKDIGHVQFSAIGRAIGADDTTQGQQVVPGLGVNLSGGIYLTKCNYVQVYGVYGKGVGGMGNDTSFVNSDGAFTAGGDLRALQYYSGMLAYTHNWNDKWRSTLTYGYVNLENTSGQAGDAYHATHYASANIVWQIKKRLSVGLEGLYGKKEVNDGRDGDVFRLQLGMVYSLFD